MWRHLFSVNSNTLYAHTRLNFMWSSFIWMTSIHNVSIVTKRNMIYSTIVMCFIIIRSDTFCPHHNTLEACEHTFGFFRGIKRFFNIMECVGIEEKISRKRAAMYESDLKRYHSWNKGCQAIFSVFVQETNNCTSGLYNKDGTFKIDSSSPSFMCIWSTLVLLIKSVNGEICQTMKGFSFLESGGFSPFSCHFPTSDMTELREKLLKYLLLIF